jgi:ABC-type polar amino acid transport system ATPase subunit
LSPGSTTIVVAHELECARHVATRVVFIADRTGARDGRARGFSARQSGRAQPFLARFNKS